MFVPDTLAVWGGPSLLPYVLLSTSVASFVILPSSLQWLDTPATEIAPTILSAASARSTCGPMTLFRNPNANGSSGVDSGSSSHPKTSLPGIASSGLDCWAYWKVTLGFFSIAPFFPWLVDGASFLQVALAVSLTVYCPRHRTQHPCSLPTPLTAGDNTPLVCIRTFLFFEATNGTNETGGHMPHGWA